MWRQLPAQHLQDCVSSSSCGFWQTCTYRHAHRLSAQHHPYREAQHGNCRTCVCSTRGLQRKGSCRQRLCCRAAEQGSESSSHTSTDSPASQESRIKQTLAGLDALLGIQEEASTSDKKDGEGKSSQDKTKVEVAPEIYKALAEAEAARNSNGKAASAGEQAELEEDVKSILDTARKLGEQVQSPGMEAKDVQAVIKDEMEKLMDKLQPGLKQDMKKIKEEVFGPKVFWVTDMQSVSDKPLEIVPGSWMVRGNLRTNRDAAFGKVLEGVNHLYGDKYAVFMVPDPEADRQEGGSGSSANAASKERVAFIVSPAKFATPQEAPAWQIVVAGVLFLLSLGTATQIGLAANVTRFLPQNIIELLSRPDSFQAESMPPELEHFDFVPLLLSSLPISTSIIVLQLIQEIGHRLVATSRDVKLGTPIFIPNGQIGLFGAVTQLKSLVRNRRDLFDIAAAGPIGSGVASLALFVTGLTLSGGGADKASLLPVPTALLQGSLLLGGATRWVLGGGAAAAASTIQVHPFVIGGWCGLVATALNCLPVGCLDGGRIMQAAFGRRSLSISSFFVYVALGLGLLGSSLALPFGLYVFICQRSTESLVQDSVSPPGSARTGLALGLLFVSILVLLPALTGIETATTSDITL